MEIIYIFDVCYTQVTDLYQYVMTVSQFEMKMLEIEGLYICKDISTSGYQLIPVKLCIEYFPAGSRIIVLFSIMNVKKSC